jgi:hypothetical protein
MRPPADLYFSCGGPGSNLGRPHPARRYGNPREHSPTSVIKSAHDELDKRYSLSRIVGYSGANDWVIAGGLLKTQFEEIESDGCVERV